MLLKVFTAVAAVAGLAFTTDGVPGAYDDSSIAKLSQADVAAHAERVFARADMDQDHALSADEYTALTVITAELAHLNGFVVIEKEDGVATAPLLVSTHAALSPAEQTRIAAVARKAFYIFAGEDGRMSADEFSASQQFSFEAADLNQNGELAKQELSVFAQRQASIAVGA